MACGESQIIFSLKFINSFELHPSIRQFLFLLALSLTTLSYYLVSLVKGQWIYDNLKLSE